MGTGEKNRKSPKLQGIKFHERLGFGNYSIKKEKL